MRVFSDFEGFEWDEVNREKNWERHKVSWWECEEAFFNHPIFVYEDDRHSFSETRFYALGKTNDSRMLFLVFTRRGNRIRVISARDMHRKERRIYHAKVKEDSKI